MGNDGEKKLHPAILCDLFGMVNKWPFKRLSDLQLGHEKVTLNHLASVFFVLFPLKVKMATMF